MKIETMIIIATSIEDCIKP